MPRVFISLQCQEALGGGMVAAGHLKRLRFTVQGEGFSLVKGLRSSLRGFQTHGCKIQLYGAEPLKAVSTMCPEVYT